MADRQAIICEAIAQTLATGMVHDPYGYEALAFLKLPGPDYMQLLRALHIALAPKLYVEIGVRQGHSLAQAWPETHCIAVDPDPRIVEIKRPDTSFVVSTSDAFFAHVGNRQRAQGFDLAFIDGDHSFDQALRDFENLERLAKPSSIIAIHDVIPMDERTAQPSSQGVAFHTGDVWRLMADIVIERPDLIAFTVACPPTGLGIVGRFGADCGKLGRKTPLSFSSDWHELAHRLRIVPNEAAALKAAFAGASPA